MEHKLEIIKKAIRKNAEKETAFVDLLNQEQKELSESFDSYLLYHGYRKESDTARDILLWLKEHTFESGFSIIETHFKDRYGVDLTEDKE